jgi:hemoglobin-like flavoprotein
LCLRCATSDDGTPVGGVRQVHYDTVATALVWTLEQGLGDDFTPATRQAWVEAYTILAGVMQQAAATA